MITLSSSSFFFFRNKYTHIYTYIHIYLRKLDLARVAAYIYQFLCSSYIIFNCRNNNEVWHSSTNCAGQFREDGIIVYVIWVLLKKQRWNSEIIRKISQKLKIKGSGWASLIKLVRIGPRPINLAKLFFVCEKLAPPHYLPGNSQRIEIVAGVMINVDFLFSIFELKTKHPMAKQIN